MDAIRSAMVQVVRQFHLQKFVLLLLCIGFMVPLAFAGGDSGHTTPSLHYYCTSDPGVHSRYYSAMFEVPAKLLYQQIADGFRKFLAQKYGVKSTPVCFGNPNQNEAESRLKQQVEQLKISKWTLIQTTWTYNDAPSEMMPMEASGSTSAAATPPPHPANPINGVYTGTYACGKGPTDLKLALNAPEYGLLRATFTFYLPPGSHTKAYTYSLNGQFNPASGNFTLNPLKWETPAPPNYTMVGLKGAVDARAGKVSGIVDYSGCGRFEAMKGRDD